MDRFVDEAVIEVSSGDGGNGRVSFRREKYVPKGGPDGGDGGRGGDVVFVVKDNLKTLSHLKFKRRYRAENGHAGQPKNMHGRNGDSVEVPVPPGSIIKDSETGEVLKEMAESGERWVFLNGGNGGFGNARFTSSTRQAPRFAIPGQPGKTLTVKVELKLIADIGFVGFPNAGKSSLLAALTNAKPKVGAYPFTTKIPNLGVMNAGYRDIILADIPGIIEGASSGAGLGLRFLRHISRSFGLAYLVDLSDIEFLDAVEVLERELAQYEPSLVRKQRIIVGTKLDIEGTDEMLAELARRYPGDRVIGVSSFSGAGIPELTKEFLRMAGGRTETTEESYTPPDYLSYRSDERVEPDEPAPGTDEPEDGR